MQEKEFHARDVIDDEERASDHYEDLCNDAVQRARTAASKIEPGQAGDCDYCGEYFARVVIREERPACAICRDKLKLG